MQLAQVDTRFRLSKELMIRSKPRKSKAESQRRGVGGREVCVILSMLFVLTSCSLLPDRKRAFREAGAQQEAEEGERRRRSEYSSRESDENGGIISTFGLSQAVDSSLVVVGERLIETDINLLRVTLKSDLNICLKDERLEAFFSSRVL